MIARARNLFAVAMFRAFCSHQEHMRQVEDRRIREIQRTGVYR